MWSRFHANTSPKTLYLQGSWNQLPVGPQHKCKYEICPPRDRKPRDCKDTPPQCSGAGSRSPGKGPRRGDALSRWVSQEQLNHFAVPESKNGVGGSEPAGEAGIPQCTPTGPRGPSDVSPRVAQAQPLASTRAAVAGDARWEWILDGSGIPAVSRPPSRRRCYLQKGKE